MHSADVVIIGGGVTGLSAAFFLSAASLLVASVAIRRARDPGKPLSTEAAASPEVS